MNERENEPLPTSFQADVPIVARAPSDDEDESIDLGRPSRLERCMVAIKAHERWGVALGVGLQLLVLGGLIVMGTAKALGGGVLR